MSNKPAFTIASLRDELAELLRAGANPDSPVFVWGFCNDYDSGACSDNAERILALELRDVLDD